MSNISSEDAWNEVVGSIDKMIANRGYPSEHREKFLKIFKPIYQRFWWNCDIELPDTIDPASLVKVREGIAKFDRALREHNSELLYERLTRELDIYMIDFLNNKGK